MKIVYTGPFRAGSMTESRRQALVDLGHQVIGVDQVPYLDRGPTALRKLRMHTLTGTGIAEYNHDLRLTAEKERPDLVYVDTGSYLWPETVSALRDMGARPVHYTSEHFDHNRHFYRFFFKAVGRYAAHVITQPNARPELERRGARRIVITEFGYDPRLHRPIALTAEERERYAEDAVFVGHWEPYAESMIHALRTAGVAVRVWGPGWVRARSLADRHTIRPIYGEEYVKVLAAAKLCLCFMSKWGRNSFAVGRTFEIPAVGSFFLAERSASHQRYYEEGREAEFFDSAAELVRKAIYYLNHDAERQAIAAAGHTRCLTSGYSHHDRCRTLLHALVN